MCEFSAYVAFNKETNKYQTRKGVYLLSVCRFVLICFLERYQSSLFSIFSHTQTKLPMHLKLKCNNVLKRETEDIFS